MYYFLISIAVIILDQLTKIWAVKYLQPISDIPIIKDAVYLTYSENRGAAFGMLSDNRWIFMIISVAIIILMSAFLIVSRKKHYHPLLLSSFAMILGGGVGNMIDRIFRSSTLFDGAVVDFIDFRIIHFAIFNVADSFVTIGEVLLVIYLVFFEFTKKSVGYDRFLSDEKGEITEKENKNGD